MEVILIKSNNYLLLILKLLLLFLCTVFISNCGNGNLDLYNDYFDIGKIISGNKIELVNGIKIQLIGINDNQSTKKYLEDSISYSKIKLTFDSKSPDYNSSGISNEPENNRFVIHAYISDEFGKSVNTDILKSGLSPLVLDKYLNDSLNSFKNYTNNIIEIHEQMIPDNNLSGCQIELEKLKQACDFNNSDTRDFAVSIGGKNTYDGRQDIENMISIGQVCEIFKEVLSKWKYVPDPNNPNEGDYFSPASRTIFKANFSGDCDDFAVVIYSLITSIGGKARINFVSDSKKLIGHAFAELNISGISGSYINSVIQSKFPIYRIGKISTQSDKYGTWLNLDWSAEYPGGEYEPYDNIIHFYPAENKCE